MPESQEADERRPLLNDASHYGQNDLEEQGRSTNGHNGSSDEKLTWKGWTAEKLEAPSTHKAIITLIAIDACCVLADLTYTFLSPERECDCLNPNSSSFQLLASILNNTNFLTTIEGEGEPIWLTVLAHISLAITTLFLLEIPLTLWCFGLNYYNPLPKEEGRERETNPYASLHLFDALVILTTFILEVVLRGREAELAGLLVLLRLWRIVKLVGGLAVGAGELQEELSNELAETQQFLHSSRLRTQELENENTQLRARLANILGTDPSSFT
ncbi:uncharacterized protein FOMMEDRAFT_166161 [Fomitiporia mediterranea MF3/22]|uniref:uncharacterized protein n=1 Tax=Fomitiporia mediterranea (strain MF3/22) TaxID=694068 RepID=UPI0004408467|nr:uncharacterized protein FOMMEDRAFT_166161 [Fomitiporia mediterranea MF3/22]EJD05839.1 hypothetical protein FOMMEDRAFT_166161 [Fomitiporia mediterranea MF3/22]